MSSSLYMLQVMDTHPIVSAAAGFPLLPLLSFLGILERAWLGWL